MEIDGKKITATVEQAGAKWKHTVYWGGEVYDTRTSAHKYAVIHVQWWRGGEHQREEGVTHWAARYSRKAKAVGTKIEYGTCAGNVAIEEVAA